MVSAELAAAFPAVVFALTLVLGAAQHGIAATRAQEAARVAARSVARGDSESVARSLAQRAAPAAAVEFSADGDRVQARVAVPAHGPTAWLVDGGRYTARAVAAKEQTGESG
ncbi:hypothetical protein IEE94_10110 [Yimella sp. cx-573]|nr:hypothetical protein [Yimella sp. cx-573]